MMNALIIGVAALLINAWADTGKYTGSSTPNFLGARLVPLASVAILAALLCWRSESRAGRAAFRIAVSTILACLLNIILFVGNDLNQYGAIRPLELQPSAIVTKTPALLDSALAVLKPGKSTAEEEEAQMQSRYPTALSRCIDDQQKQQHSSYKAAKTECIDAAARIGRSAFITRYSRNLRHATARKATSDQRAGNNSGS
jgi:hypothetical protein